MSPWSADGLLQWNTAEAQSLDLYCASDKKRRTIVFCFFYYFRSNEKSLLFRYFEAVVFCFCWFAVVFLNRLLPTHCCFLLFTWYLQNSRLLPTKYPWFQLRGFHLWPIFTGVFILVFQNKAIQYYLCNFSSYASHKLYPCQNLLCNSKIEREQTNKNTF